MRNQTVLTWLVVLIGGLALFAAGAGLFWPAAGEPYPFTSVQGEQTLINNRGLYRYDTVSSAAQMQANDLITLVLGLPLLAAGAWLAGRGSLRGQLLLAGTLGFFLYTYMSMSVNTAYNPLFLVYVALFTLSLSAFGLSLAAINRSALPARFSERLPRRGIAGVFLAAGVFLIVAWVGGRIAPTWRGQTPALENGTTMVIQAMDLGLIVPLCFLSSLLLLRRSPWGYLLAAVFVMKMVTMGTAVSAMAINMALSGVPDSPIILIVFATLTVLNLIMAGLLLASVDPPPGGPAARFASAP